MHCETQATPKGSVIEVNVITEKAFALTFQSHAPTLNNMSEPQIQQKFKGVCFPVTLDSSLSD